MQSSNVTQSYFNSRSNDSIQVCSNYFVPSTAASIFAVDEKPWPRSH